jgi:hypothetical protein
MLWAQVVASVWLALACWSAAAAVQSVWARLALRYKQRLIAARSYKTRMKIIA